MRVAAKCLLAVVFNMADFFVVRDGIKAQIEAAVPEVRRVYFAEDLDGVKEASQITPAVHLLYQGYSPAQAERARVDITLDQVWAVVLVLRQAQGDYGGGEILDKLVQALHGFQPSGAVMKLELSNSPFSPSYRPRVAYYPLAFSTRVINRKGA